MGKQAVLFLQMKSRAYDPSYCLGIGIVVCELSACISGGLDRCWLVGDPRHCEFVVSL